jgi:hypothetical protein
MPSLLSSRPGPRNTKKKNKILEPLLGFFFAFSREKTLAREEFFTLCRKLMYSC